MYSLPFLVDNQFVDILSKSTKSLKDDIASIRYSPYRIWAYRPYASTMAKLFVCRPNTAIAHYESVCTAASPRHNDSHQLYATWQLASTDNE